MCSNKVKISKSAGSTIFGLLEAADLYAPIGCNAVKKYSDNYCKNSCVIGGGWGARLKGCSRVFIGHK